MINPVLAAWETEIRVRRNQQLAEQLRLQRMAEGARHPSRGGLAGFSVARLRGIWAGALARSSSRAGTAGKMVLGWLWGPPAAEEECTEA